MTCQIEDMDSAARLLADYGQHERVVRVRDDACGLHGLIAVHNTWRGPGVGGCRVWQYRSETEALTDALRLAAGMTYKNAMAELPFGGGKAVILAPAGGLRDRRSAMAAFGRAVQQLGGIYCTAEDVGTNCDDMAVIHQQTDHIFGLSQTSGDPSPFTAYGVYLGIEAAVAHHLNQTKLTGVHVVVQGLGNVGHGVCKLLHQAGARLTVSDINVAAVQRCRDAFNAGVVEPDAVYDVPADVYAPCALGATINDATLPRLRVRIIAGAANNQLAREKLARRLTQRGILYAPDYVINAGGIVNIACERGDYSPQRARHEVAKIAPRLQAIFMQAQQQCRTTMEVANELARQRFSRRPEPARSVTCACPATKGE